MAAPVLKQGASLTCSPKGLLDLVKRVKDHVGGMPNQPAYFPGSYSNVAQMKEEDLKEIFLQIVGE